MTHLRNCFFSERSGNVGRSVFDPKYIDGE